MEEFLNYSTTINNLPDELILLFFEYIQLEDVVTCENVCKRWRNLAHDPKLWKRFVIVCSGKPSQIEVHKKSLKIVSSHSHLIYSLKIQYYFYPEIERVVETCKNLTSIELLSCKIGKSFVEVLIQRTELTKLCLKNCIQNLDDMEVLFNFNHLKKLRHLVLPHFGLAPENCDTLLELKNLSHIYINKIKMLELNYVKSLIISKQNLETLHIYGGDAIDDCCLDLLSRCSNLSNLGIERCDNLTDKGILALINFKKLQHLKLWRNDNFSEIALIKSLQSASLIRLETLSFSTIKNITPKVVDIISENYKNLKVLSLYQCPEIVNTDYETQLQSKFRNIAIVLY